MKRLILFFAALSVLSISVFAQTQDSPKWHIKAASLFVDNCPMTACPCLLGGMPYQGVCRGIGVMKITEGNYNGVTLDGQLIGMYVEFHDMSKPDGMGYYIDQNADPKVKKALNELLSAAPFGLMGEGYTIKETTIKSDFKSGMESSFSIGDFASLTLTPLTNGDGKSQMSIKNPVDPFGAKEIFLNNGKGFYKDYGQDLTYNDNSGEVEEFELSGQ